MIHVSTLFMYRVALIIGARYKTSTDESKTMINIWYSRYYIYMYKIREGEGQSISVSNYDYIKLIRRGGTDRK